MKTAADEVHCLVIAEKNYTVNKTVKLAKTLMIALVVILFKIVMLMMTLLLLILLLQVIFYERRGFMTYLTVL